jgi:hypothetical protein
VGAGVLVGVAAGSAANVAAGMMSDAASVMMPSIPVARRRRACDWFRNVVSFRSGPRDEPGARVSVSVLADVGDDGRRG